MVIICAVDGGFRRGELLNAKWRDVDFEEGTIAARNYKGKSLSTRAVFMTARMKFALIEWKTLQKQIRKIKDKSRVIGYDAVTNGWETIREKINRPDLRLHDLRHVFGTRLNEKRVPLRDIQLLLGHSDIKTTQIYINPQAEDLRESARQIEETD